MSPEPTEDEKPKHWTETDPKFEYVALLEGKDIIFMRVRKQFWKDQGMEWLRHPRNKAFKTEEEKAYWKEQDAREFKVTVPTVQEEDTTVSDQESHSEEEEESKETGLQKYYCGTCDS
jgi:hypothetical protein